MCPQPTPTFPAPADLHAMQAAQARPVHTIAPGSRTSLVIPTQSDSQSAVQQAVDTFWIGSSDPNATNPGAIADLPGGLIGAAVVLVLLWKLISSGTSSMAHMIVDSERSSSRKPKASSYPGYPGGLYD